MSEQLIPEIPLMDEQARLGIGDRLRQIPATAREHVGKFAVATLAGLGLLAPNIPVDEIPTSVAAAEAAPADAYSDTPLTSTASEPETFTSAAEQKKVSGYWMLAGHGLVMSFGDAKYHGSGPQDSVGIAPTPSGNGYWIAKSNGVVLPYGDTELFARAPGVNWDKKETITTIAATPEGEGFWTASTLGRVFSYGNAKHFGDMSRTNLNQPVIGMIPTTTGEGYWLLASDGGVFSFGDAEFHGSTGDKKLNAPVVDMIPDPDNDGYWLLAADGGVFSFNANFHGSTGNMKLNKPVVGGLPYGNEYAFYASDGGFFNFSKQPFMGSAANNPHMYPVVAAAVKKS